MKKIVFSMMCCFVAMTASAQSASWNSVIDAEGDELYSLKLEKFGRYQDGQEITSACPSESTGNSQETLTLTFNKAQGTYALTMNDTMDGWAQYTGSYSGNMLRHKTSEYKGKPEFSACTGFWRLLSFEKLDGGKFRIITLDDNNIYRYYVGGTSKIDDQLFETLLFEYAL